MTDNVYATIISAGADTLGLEIAAFNKMADQIIHADNAYKLVHELRDVTETTDENILKFREYKEKVLANLRENEEKIEQYIISNNLVDTTPIDVEAVTSQAKEKATLIKNLKATLSSLPGGTDALSGLPEVSKLPGISRAGGSGAGGTGIKRPRLASITMDGVNIEEVKGDKHIATISVLVTHLKKNEYLTATGEEITTSFLQAHLFEAAGVSDLAALNGKPIEFSLALLKGEAKAEVTVSLVCVPSVPNS